jgi:glycosidase
MKKLFLCFFQLSVILNVFGQSTIKTPPEWSKASTIYEVNLRQYTHSGTIKEFTTHLPRLKQMGIDILWFMPVQPIGLEKRKGTLGSYYSIKDYTAVNPEFGTMEDFKKMVDEVHGLGMHIILDWVANHSSYDNVWIRKKPEWYTHDDKGNIIPPVADWSDVADLNYDQQELREAMINSMKFWIKEANIDGFRCDVAMEVPMDFWQHAIDELQAIKSDIFMLAEAEGSHFHNDAFDMTYGWNMHHQMNLVAQGKKRPAVLDSIIIAEQKEYPKEAYRMQFTSNHDENSWNGTEFERMGEAAQLFAVYAATIPGMLLIYSGQEVALNKRLQFFDKDEIIWSENHPYTKFYSTLIKLKHDHPALWNGAYGGSYRQIDDGNETVFSFTCEKEKDKIIVLLNMSNTPQTILLSEEKGKYRNVFADKKLKIKGHYSANLKPWEYIVLSK